MHEVRCLPNLLYVGDVPVESTYHGSLLLYRIFVGYPTDKLVIFETDMAPSSPERRLPGVLYHCYRLLGRRLLRTRFSGIYSAWLGLLARYRTYRLRRQIVGFAPEAIISVAHGYHWMTAARLAEQFHVPFHLIVHDHPLQITALPSPLRAFLESAFGLAYKQAVTRSCVSPYMEEEYAARYGVSGSVLYPSRDRDCPRWEAPPERDPDTRRLRIAFAGTINSGGYARLLRLLAESLHSEDTLTLFGPHTPESVRHWHLEAENVQVAGLLSPGELIERLRREFDVLFVPMSFEVAGHADNMRLSFPSKIADYTATGIPLLVCGPEYCSAVRWARSNQPIAELVTSERPDELAGAISELRSPSRREFLARRALEVGEHLFSHAAAESILFSALTKNAKLKADSIEPAHLIGTK
jgi:hypothetical protein